METTLIIATIIVLGIVLLWQQKKKTRRMEMINFANAVMQDICNERFVRFYYTTYDAKNRLGIDKWQQEKSNAYLLKTLRMDIDKTYTLWVYIKIYDPEPSSPKTTDYIVSLHQKDVGVVFYKTVILKVV
jgi:hypothetical protein